MSQEPDDDHASGTPEARVWWRTLVASGWVPVIVTLILLIAASALVAVAVGG